MREFQHFDETHLQVVVVLEVDICFLQGAVNKPTVEAPRFPHRFLYLHVMCLERVSRARD